MCKEFYGQCELNVDVNGLKKTTNTKSISFDCHFVGNKGICDDWNKELIIQPLIPHLLQNKNPKQTSKQHKYMNTNKNESE